MSIISLFKRIIRFYHAKGLVPAIKRSWTVSRRSLFQDRTLVFALDTALWKCGNALNANGERVIIERKTQLEDIQTRHLDTIIDYRGTYLGKEIIRKQIGERLKKGANIWLLEIDGTLAGFIWTIRNGMVSPYYLPVTANDAVIFDTETFPIFRGRGLNSFFLEYCLEALKQEGVVRCYISVKEWNKPSIRAISKTAFHHPIAFASQYHLFGRNIVIWHSLKKASKLLMRQE